MLIQIALVAVAMAVALIATALFFEEGDRVVNWYYARGPKMDHTSTVGGERVLIPNTTPPKVTVGQVAAHIVTFIVTLLGTAYYNKPPAPPAQPAPATVTAPPSPSNVAEKPLAAAPANPPTVYHVDTLRIEAGKVELVGNVQVTIPEIKPPNVIVENKLPQAVVDALNKPQPAPVVNFVVDPTKLLPARLPEPVTAATPVKDEFGELLPPPKDAKPAAPVRVWPKEEK